MGKLMRNLKEWGMWEDTTIIFMSDHGTNLGERPAIPPLYRQDEPACPCHLNLYDINVKVAFILKDPDVPKGVRIPGQVRAVDIIPTILDLVDIPAATTSLPKGAESDAVVPKGKATGPSAHGVRGANNFGMFMASNPDMAGDYGGYDGPAPPWNDEIMHHYIFTVYALDTASLGLNGDFGGPEALAAMEGHVLAKGSCTGIYTLNKELL